MLSGMPQLTYGNTTYTISANQASKLEDELPTLLSSGKAERIVIPEPTRTTTLYITPGVPIALHVDL
jgi:hypothetical protein